MRFLFSIRLTKHSCMYLTEHLRYEQEVTQGQFLSGFQISHKVKQCLTRQRTNYIFTTNHHALNCFGHVMYALQISTC